jgi:hypothetical protein
MSDLIALAGTVPWPTPLPKKDVAIAAGLWLGIAVVAVVIARMAK